MDYLFEAKKPFEFVNRLYLLESTGLRAANLSQLLDCVKTAPVSSIYYHTHAFFQEYQYTVSDSTNDFAYWASQAIGEVELGARLSKLDMMRYSKIHELQAAIAQTIETYLSDNEFAKTRVPRNNEEFYFIKSTSFMLPTIFRAYDLKDMAEILKTISVDSIYFHIFEARLRLERPTNDFSAWIEGALGDKELAGRIAQLDPYMRTLEDLRRIIIRAIEKRMVD